MAVPTETGVHAYSIWDAEPPLLEAPLPLSPMAATVFAFSDVAFRPDGTLGLTSATGAEHSPVPVTIPVPSP